MGESFRSWQGADQVYVQVAEMSERERNVLGLHVDVPVYLTLLAGEACTGHGSHRHVSIQTWRG